MIKAGETLLFDSRQQYPGLVVNVSEEYGTYDIHWYKWGYNSPDGFIQEYMHFKRFPDLVDDWVSKYVVDESHKFFRAHGLPPESLQAQRENQAKIDAYIQQENAYRDAEVTELRRLVDLYAAGVWMNGNKNVIEERFQALVEFYLEGRG